jgi:hypothetical protein
MMIQLGPIEPSGSDARATFTALPKWRAVSIRRATVRRG